jgi:hypothetical protein
MYFIRSAVEDMEPDFDLSAFLSAQTVGTADAVRHWITSTRKSCMAKRDVKAPLTIVKADSGHEDHFASFEDSQN